MDPVQLSESKIVSSYSLWPLVWYMIIHCYSAILSV